METAYINFYSSSFAQPLRDVQRLEAMSANVYNANELAVTTVQYCTLALTDIDSHSHFSWQNQNHFDLQFSIGAPARARAPGAGQVRIGLY